jgi:hypothetical protein
MGDKRSAGESDESLLGAHPSRTSACENKRKNRARHRRLFFLCYEIESAQLRRNLAPYELYGR